MSLHDETRNALTVMILGTPIPIIENGTVSTAYKFEDKFYYFGEKMKKCPFAKDKPEKGKMKEETYEKGMGKGKKDKKDKKKK